MTGLWAGHSASSRPDHKERARSDQQWVGRERPELISGQSFSANLESVSCYREEDLNTCRRVYFTPECSERLIKTNQLVTL